MTKAAQRLQEHQETLDYLVSRLSQKPGELFVEERYEADGFIGEMDIHKVTINTAGKVFHRYYEVKGRPNSYGRKHAKTQFKKVTRAFPEVNYKKIYFSNGIVKRYWL